MKKTASLQIVTAGILWGCMGLFVRRLNSLGLVSMQIVQLRAMVAAAVLLALLLIRNPGTLRIRLKDLWCFLGTGICSILFFNYCYFKTISLTSLSVAAVLLYTAPAIVMVLSCFLFREKLTFQKILALALTFAGCVLVTGVLDQDSVLSPMGILIGLGAGLGYALYSIFSRYALERGYSSLTITCYTFFTAFLGSLFLTDIRNVLPTAFSSLPTGLVSVGLGVICTVMPFFLYTIGLSRVENSSASILASVEPVTATVLGIAVFGETLTVCGAIGILLVLTALTICSR